MPELPEVETVRRGLHHLITGYRIVQADDLHPRALKAESIAPLSTLNGARITGTGRRGKFLWITLDGPFVLVAHLGMSGQFLIQEKDRPAAKHIRAQFSLKKSLRKLELVFNDQRTFGWLSIEQLTDGVPSSAHHIALDPFDPDFDYQGTIKKFAQRRVRIKTALLNQEIMSGVGNIYADEALWRAKVHPELLTSEMSKKKIASVIDSATEVMREAIAKEDVGAIIIYAREKANGQYNEIMPALSIFDRHWAGLADSNRTAIWKYMKVLIILSDKAQSTRV
jgi:formamidopyrimidine-DNA glycosylase